MRTFNLVLLFILLNFFTLNAKESYLKKADRYFSEGKFSLAEIFYKKVLQETPDSFVANYNLGKIYYNNDKYKNAIKHLKTAYDIIPDKEVLFLMASCYILDNQIKKGMSIYTNLLKKYPDYADVHLNAGLVYLKYLYDKEGTIYHWENFLKLRPDDPQAPAIRKALQYLKDPNFVLKPPSTEKETPTGTGTETVTVTETGATALPVIIKGKDLKTKSEEKYKLKEKKTITTE